MSSNFTVKRICEQCQGIFEAKTTVTRFCSARCNKKTYKLRKRASIMVDTDSKVRAILTKPTEILQAKEFLNVSDAAKLLNTSTKMIYRMIEERKLKAVNLSIRKTVICRKEIDRLFETKAQDKLYEENIVVRPKVRDSYSMTEAQKKFKISEAGLYQLIKRHKISKFKNGWYTYVLKKDIDVIFNATIK